MFSYFSAISEINRFFGSSGMGGEMHSNLVQDFLEAFRAAPSDAERSRCMEAMSGAVLGTPGAAKELVTIIGTAESDTPEIEPLHLVFEAVLDVSRMALENRQPEGIRFLEAVDTCLAALAASDTLTTEGRLSLGHAFVGAGLPPPEHLVAETDEFFDIGDAFDGIPDIDGLIDSLAADAGSDPIATHTAFSGMMATFPIEVRGMIVDHIASRPEEFYARVGAYWLLDVDATLRQAAAEGFLQRTLAGNMDAATAEKLISLRSWLPDDAARGVLDKAIKEAIRREVAGGAMLKPWTLHRIFASLPDGAGAQSIAIAAQSGGQRGIVMLLLKQDLGVKDAYLIPCSSASEQKRFLATITEEVDALAVTEDFVREALAIALGEGIEVGLLPAPGLIDVISVCGLQDLRPEARSVADMIGVIDPDGSLATMTAKQHGTLVARSSNWGVTYNLIDTWFEDNADFHDALKNAKSPQEKERGTWAFLSTRRAWWARMIARTARTLNATGDPAWLEFAATALALETGRDLKRTPIMQAIAKQSLGAPQNQWEPFPEEFLEELEPEYVDAPTFVASEKKNELTRLLKISDASPAWVDGFLMAIVVSPKMVAPGKWIEPLLGILPEEPDEVSLQRYLDIVMLRYNTANETAPNADETKIQIDRLSSRALVDWSSGFVTVTKLFKSCWPTKALKKDDKSILRLLAETAEDGKDSPLLKSILPTWLEQRFDLRK